MCHFMRPLDFAARLAALVPKPRINLTRYHGVFAPNSHLRAQVKVVILAHPCARGIRASMHIIACIRLHGCRR